MAKLSHGIHGFTNQREGVLTICTYVSHKVNKAVYGTRNPKISIAHRQAGDDFLRINILSKYNSSTYMIYVLQYMQSF